MTDLAVLGARAEFYRRCWWGPELCNYLAHHRIDLGSVLPHVGAVGLMDVVEFHRDRFDFCGPGERITCLVIEAIDIDGATPLDLVSLPLSEPERPMTMFGRIGFINPWVAFNPATFFMGKRLLVHRHARDWLASGVPRNNDHSSRHCRPRNARAARAAPCPRSCSRSRSAEDRRKRPQRRAHHFRRSGRQAS